jgi:multiple antibiotic resistance protein
MSWIEIFVLLFVTIGPVRASLVYLGLTKSADATLKRAIAFRTVSVSAVITVIFALLGELAFLRD